MKRIVFLLKKQPAEGIKTEYSEYAKEYGIKVLYLEAVNDQSEEADEVCKSNDSDRRIFIPEYEDIVCTDSPWEYNRLVSIGENAVVSLEDLLQAELFEGAQYLLLDCLDTEIEYYHKVWMRFRNIPWPITKTERLIIRETTVEDVDTFIDLYKDPSMYKYTEALYEDPEEERKYASEYIEKVYKVQGFGIWTVILAESNQIIGRAGIVTREGFDGVEIGYSIGTEYQNKGYATEAVRACISFAKEHELGSVRILTMKENTASIKVAEKCGFLNRGICKINDIVYQQYLLEENEI